jgi:hypothetical protein
MGALLRRECALVVVSDVDEDRHYRFPSLMKLYRRIRLTGVNILPLSDDFRSRCRAETLDLEPVRPRTDRNCDEHFILARIVYASAQQGLLIYIKPTFTGDEPPDLLRFRDEHEDFPHHPGSQQMYDEVFMESYRQLGYHIGTVLCRRLADAEFTADFSDRSLWLQCLAQALLRTAASEKQVPHGDGTPEPVGVKY